jgi:hypothetical protein
MLTHYQSTRTLSVTSAVLGAGFFLGALAHIVGWLPFGSLANEPQILPAALVELFCGLAMLYAAVMLRSAHPEGFPRAFGAHVGAIMAVIVGMISLTLGVGESTEMNTTYHGVMLLLLLLNAVGLWRMRPRNPIKRVQHRIAARLY